MTEVDESLLVSMRDVQMSNFGLAFSDMVTWTLKMTSLLICLRVIEFSTSSHAAAMMASQNFGHSLRVWLMLFSLPGMPQIVSESSKLPQLEVDWTMAEVPRRRLVLFGPN